MEVTEPVLTHLQIADPLDTLLDYILEVCVPESLIADLDSERYESLADLSLSQVSDAETAIARDDDVQGTLGVRLSLS